MRIGLFGGSFDPVHLGHLIAAEAAREQAGLDRVLFMPACVPPHKQSTRLASAADRLTMLELAVGGNDAFEVSAAEIDRGGVSYTVETVEWLHRERPRDTLLLLLGPDALAEFPRWHRPERIVELAELLPVERDTLDDVASAADASLAELLGEAPLGRLIERRVRSTAIGIRSTELRADIAAGRSIRYRVPAAVKAFIHSHGLYRPE